MKTKNCPAQARWIESFLARDEDSTDQELIAYFTENGLSDQEAAEAVARRDEAQRKSKRRTGMADLSGFRFTGAVAQRQARMEELARTVQEQAEGWPDDLSIDDVIRLLASIGQRNEKNDAAYRGVIMQALTAIGGAYQAYRPEENGKRSNAIRFRRRQRP